VIDEEHSSPPLFSVTDHLFSFATAGAGTEKATPFSFLLFETLPSFPKSEKMTPLPPPISPLPKPLRSPSPPPPPHSSDAPPPEIRNKSLHLFLPSASLFPPTKSETLPPSETYISFSYPLSSPTTSSRIILLPARILLFIHAIDPTGNSPAFLFFFPSVAKMSLLPPSERTPCARPPSSSISFFFPEHKGYE